MWQNTGLTSVFLMVDAKASYPLLLFIIHPRAWTAILWGLSVLLFGFLSYRGYKVNTAIRMFRAWLSGPVVSSKPFWLKPEFDRYPQQ